MHFQPFMGLAFQNSPGEHAGPSWLTHSSLAPSAVPTAQEKFAKFLVPGVVLFKMACASALKVEMYLGNGRSKKVKWHFSQEQTTITTALNNILVYWCFNKIQISLYFRTNIAGFHGNCTLLRLRRYTSFRMRKWTRDCILGSSLPPWFDRKFTAANAEWLEPFLFKLNISVSKRSENESTRNQGSLARHAFTFSTFSLQPWMLKLRTAEKQNR